MRRLISGDIRRILSKLGFYILPGIYFLISLVDLATTPMNMDFETAYLGWETEFKYIFTFVVAIPVFMGVYADELRTGAMQISIGRGISRRKVLFSKFFDCFIITLILYILAYILKIAELRRNMLILTPQQNIAMNTIILASFLKVIGAMTFSAIFCYLSWNASVGLIVEMISVGLAEMVLGLIQNNLSIPVLDYSYIGMAGQACASLAAGNNWILPMLITFAYLVVFLVISAAIFDRKELEL